MANISHFSVFIATVLVPLVLATDHIVGDAKGWNTGVDYSSWTVGKSFFVGDNLIFRYKKGAHNVFDVNVTAFSECATPTDQLPLESGNDVIQLVHPGIKWFICSTGHHCQSGQKLIISVQNPPTPPTSRQTAPQPSFLPPTPVPVPTLPPTMPAAPPPSVQSPGQNKTNPQLPAPTPSESSPEPQSPAPSATAPPPSGAATKSSVFGHLEFLALVLAVGVLVGIV